MIKKCFGGEMMEYAGIAIIPLLIGILEFLKTRCKSKNHPSNIFDSRNRYRNRLVCCWRYENRDNSGSVYRAISSRII